VAAVLTKSRSLHYVLKKQEEIDKSEKTTLKKGTMLSKNNTQKNNHVRE
jgi:hypothetical protein